MMEFTGPDGMILSFPANTPQDIMREALERRYSQPEHKPFIQRTLTSAGNALNFTGNVVRQMANAVPILGDKLNESDAASTVGLLGGDYETELKRQNDQDARFQAEHPGAAATANLVGAVASGAALTKLLPRVMGATGPTLGGRVLSGAGANAALGAGDAAVRSDGDTFETAKGGAIGLVTGAASPIAAKGLGAVAQGIANRRAALGVDAAIRTAAKSAPATAAIKEASDRMFTEAAEAGISIKPDAYKSFVNRLIRDARSKGADPKLTPEIIRVIQRLQQNADRPKTLKELDMLRHVIRLAGDGGKSGVKTMAETMENSLDDWLENLPDHAVKGGDARTLGQTLKEARELLGQSRRAGLIEKIMEKAKIAEGGFGNGLKTGFRSLLDDDAAMRGFSDIDRRAMEAVLAGAAPERILRFLSKESEGVTPSVAAAVGVLAGEVPGAVGGALLPGAARAGLKWGADKLTESGARYAASVVRMPRTQQTPFVPVRKVDQNAIDRYTASILTGGGFQENAHTDGNERR
jgi:hypothetical protein